MNLPLVPDAVFEEVIDHQRPVSRHHVVHLPGEVLEAALEQVADVVHDARVAPDVSERLAGGSLNSSVLARVRQGRTQLRRPLVQEPSQQPVIDRVRRMVALLGVRCVRERLAPKDGLPEEDCLLEPVQVEGAARELPRW